MLAVATAVSYLWAIEVVREDDTPVDQREVAPDWGPWSEWVRWLGVRAGQSPETAFAGAPEILPAWDDARGEPRLRGVVVRSGDQGYETGLEPFREPARETVARLVDEGRLAPGETVRWRALAFAREAPDPDRPGRKGREVAPPIPIRPGRLGTSDALHTDGDDPVLIADSVLAEIGELTLATPDQETGGILVGHLCRDPRDGIVFGRVTAQVPARHTEASATRLTFTPDTWACIRDAIALRRREEIMLGWWHSHPVRAWCRECDDACRAECTMADGFLSAEDRRLHRLVFPRAFNLALVSSDVSDAGPAFALFGWRRGMLERRGFIRIDHEDT